MPFSSLHSENCFPVDNQIFFYNFLYTFIYLFSLYIYAFMYIYYIDYIVFNSFGTWRLSSLTRKLTWGKSWVLFEESLSIIFFPKYYFLIKHLEVYIIISWPPSTWKLWTLVLLSHWKSFNFFTFYCELPSPGFLFCSLFLSSSLSLTDLEDTAPGYFCFITWNQQQ